MSLLVHKQWIFEGKIPLVVVLCAVLAVKVEISASFFWSLFLPRWNPNGGDLLVDSDLSPF